MTTTHLHDAPSAVRAAIDAFGKDTVLSASRRLTNSGCAVTHSPIRARTQGRHLPPRDEVKSQTRVDEIRTETVTRFPRGQLVQLVLLIALVYVAYPFISSVPTFLTELRTANWWFALGLAALVTYLGAAAALWAAADGVVEAVGPDRHAGGQQVRRHDHPGRRRRPRAQRRGTCRRAVSPRCARQPQSRCSSRCR